MKRITTEASVEKHFGTGESVDVAQNKIGFAAVNGDDSFFTISAGANPLHCNMFMRIQYATDLDTYAAAAEIIVMNRASVSSVLYPSPEQILTADDRYPAHIRAVAENKVAALSIYAYVHLEFPVLADSPLVIVRNINIAGMHNFWVWYNLVQIK